MDDQSCVLLAKPNTGDYYEGSRNFLRAIYPRPNVSPATVEGYLPHHEVVFREDSYDPTTRTRRGRFYSTSGHAHLQEGRVSYHPYLKPIVFFGGPAGQFEFQWTFAQDQKLNTSVLACVDYGVLIGVPPAQTVWRVIDAEALSDGTTLFTLKSLSSLGLLPALDTKLQEVTDAAEKVIEAIKYSPVPIVDVCRESARVVIATKVESDDKGKDLAKIAEALEKKSFIGAALAGKIIARLHSRGKSSDQEKQAKDGKFIRPVMDEDAVLAIRLFGFILSDLGYTKI